MCEEPEPVAYENRFTLWTQKIFSESYIFDLNTWDYGERQLLLVKNKKMIRVTLLEKCVNTVIHKFVFS